MDYIGNVKSGKGNNYKVFWDKNTYAVEFSENISGPFYKAHSATNETNAKKNAKYEADKKEDLII